jgi:glycosyltransferase involved in cell wall biosynthesis
MPSPAELQSIATLEAMASGKPIVAVDAGALKELCQTDRNGFLCAQDDDEAIAESLLRILQDKKLATAFGHQSLDIANSHDIRTTLAEFERLYTTLIND